MPNRTLYGQTYEEVAIVAFAPIPVDIGGSSITFTGTMNVGNVTVTNTNASPVPVSDAGGSITVDTAAGALSVTGPLTDTQLRASAVPVTGALTDTQLRASALKVINDTSTSLAINDNGGSVTVDGSVSVSNTVAVSGPLTDTQLRATALPVSDGNGSLTVDGTVAISTNLLTDAQLRATAVPVVGSVAVRAPTTTSINSTTSSTAILAANASRRGLMVSNQSTSKLYLSFNVSASAGNSFIQMDPGAFLFLDQQMIFTNAIYGVWTNANGTAQVTEFV
jgi:hypothetical protein